MNDTLESNEHRVNELGKAIELAYDSILLTKSGNEQEILGKLDEYDLLVDKLIHLTNGNKSAFFTDPMQAEDFKALLGKTTHGMTYNDMAEELGAKFIDGLCGEKS